MQEGVLTEMPDFEEAASSDPATAPEKEKAPSEPQAGDTSSEEGEVDDRQQALLHELMEEGVLTEVPGAEGSEGSSAGSTEEVPERGTAASADTETEKAAASGASPGEGGGTGVRPAEEAAGPEEETPEEFAAGAAEEEEPADGPIDYARFREIVFQLGGDLELSTSAVDGTVKSLHLRLPAEAQTVNRIRTLLAAGIPGSSFPSALSDTGSEGRKVLKTIHDFLVALSSGRAGQARKVLRNLAVVKGSGGPSLQDEVAPLTGKVLESLKAYVESANGSAGAENMQDLAGKAAENKVRMVEEMRRRNQQDLERVNRLRQRLESLKAIGSSAEETMRLTRDALQELEDSVGEREAQLSSLLREKDYLNASGEFIGRTLAVMKPSGQPAERS
jgi:hypothetical protein